MLGADVTSRLFEAAQSKITNYPCNNIRASAIGELCERRLVLSITKWDEAKTHDAGLQFVFDLGNTLESHFINQLKATGLDVLTTVKNFKIDKPLITGRSDFRIQDPETGDLIPCEFKSVSPYVYDSINNMQDMLNHKYLHIRRYPGQVLSYLYAENKEHGLFILFNKVTGRVKVLDVQFDYDYYESLLKKAERVYSHIDANTLPNMLEDTTHCADCPFLHVCGQSVDRGQGVIDDGTLEELLQRREALLPTVQEFTEVKKLIKSQMRDCDRAFTASYFVQKKTVVRKPFVVAGSVFTKEIIKKIGGKNETNKNI